MRYFNTLRNQWLSSRAWMLSTLVFMFFSMYLLTVIVGLSRNTPVRLVPYDFAAHNGYVTVDTTGLGDKTEYLTSIASADVMNYASWSHRTISRQMGRFLNRMSPRLYARVGATLLSDAEKKSKTEQSQSFFIESLGIKDSKVRVSGLLTMYVGSELTRTVKMTYEIEYQSNNGMPQIVDFKALETGNLEGNNK